MHILCISTQEGVAIGVAGLSFRELGDPKIHKRCTFDNIYRRYISNYNRNNWSVFGKKRNYSKWGRFPSYLR